MSLNTHNVSIQNKTKIAGVSSRVKKGIVDILSLLALLGSLAPWFNLIVFWLYEKYVFDCLGHLPKPMIESVNLPHSALYESIAGYSCEVLIWSVPIWLVLTLIPRIVRRNVLATLIFWTGIAVTILAVMLDRSHFFPWWID